MQLLTSLIFGSARAWGVGRGVGGGGWVGGPRVPGRTGLGSARFARAWGGGEGGGGGGGPFSKSTIFNCF